MVSQPYITVRGIIYLDEKIFLQKLKGKDGANSFWSTPGGKLDAGESLVGGLRRELIEETGIEPSIGKLLFMQQFIDKNNKEWLEFFYHIENAKDYLTIDLEDTTHGVAEVSECGFVDPKKLTVLPEAIGTLDIAKYIEGNQPVYLMNYL